MLKKIYDGSDYPMRIVLFSSGGPGNTNALLALQDAYPNLINVSLVVVDRLGIPTVDIAQSRGIPIIYREFDQLLEHATDKETVQKKIHDEILFEIRKFESKSWKVDLAVLAYRRIIRGSLLEYFSGRMINQHPADLSIYSICSKQRKYVGINGHKQSLLDGMGGARTSCFLVDEGIDSGILIGQGQFVPFTGDFSEDSIFEHEQLQKKMSDWPLLQTVVYHIALGNISLEINSNHPERQLFFSGERLGYTGIQISASFPAVILT